MRKLNGRPDQLPLDRTGPIVRFWCQAYCARGCPPHPSKPFPNSSVVASTFRNNSRSFSEKAPAGNVPEKGRAIRRLRFVNVIPTWDVSLAIGHCGESLAAAYPFYPASVVTRQLNQVKTSNNHETCFGSSSMQFWARPIRAPCALLRNRRALHYAPLEDLATMQVSSLFVFKTLPATSNHNGLAGTGADAAGRVLCF